jgi:hypothetical protein
MIAEYREKVMLTKKKAMFLKLKSVLIVPPLSLLFYRVTALFKFSPFLFLYGKYDRFCIVHIKLSI